MRELLIELLGDNYSKIGHIISDGKTWYKALDVCKVLGIKNTSLAVKGNVRIGYFGIEMRDIYRIDALKKSPLFISEAGIYKLILKSRKAPAVKIKNYLSQKVITEIMESGSYNFDPHSVDKCSGHVGCCNSLPLEANAA